MDIRHEDYYVAYNPHTATLTCKGSFRLRGSVEYAPILQLLTEVAAAKPPTITLDIRALQFLNSSGINTLANFVLQIRKHGVSQVLVKGSGQFPWQQTSLKNFQRLLPGLQLEMEIKPMEIIHEDYYVAYDPHTTTLMCKGSFRLRGSVEYAPVLQLLTEVAATKPPTITLDIRALQFLNSSGINTLANFVLQIRKHGVSQVLIKGSRQFPWQQTSLKNFQRLLPGLQLEIE